jgi:hypothetical protein
LYHGQVSPKLCLGAVLLAVALPAAAAHAADGADRLERFRALAATRLAAAQLVDEGPAADLTADLYVLVDEEIIESLGSGGVFASLGFLQDRLDGFAEAWGGASLKLTQLGPLTVGAFQLGDGGGTVRVYGGTRGEATLLAALAREGRPVIHPLPLLPGGSAQFFVAWEGRPTGRGSRTLRVDLVRQHGEAVGAVWSTADVFPDGLVARAWRVRGGEIRVRYEVRYPGWRPGCERQTEYEDVYRLVADPKMVVRVSRQQHNTWHQALHRNVTALFSALAGGDGAAISALVPDPRLRERLPALEEDTACDAVEPPGATVPTTVSVAATAADGRPWALTWERRGPRWRMRGAAPVLQ